jgi:hypothetical protein
MFIGCVVGDQVDDHLQPSGVGVLQHGVEVGQRTKSRVHLPVIGDVVTAVRLRGPVERREPDGVDPELLQVGQACRDTGQVAHAVTVPVGEGTWIDLIDSCVGPPRRCLGSRRADGAVTHSCLSGNN